MSNATGGVVVAMARRAERRLVDALRRQGATSAARAIPLPMARPAGKAALRRLMRDGAIMAAGERYWLNEGQYEAVREKRRVGAVLALVVIGIIIVAMVALRSLRP